MNELHFFRMNTHRNQRNVYIAIGDTFTYKHNCTIRSIYCSFFCSLCSLKIEHFQCFSHAQNRPRIFLLGLLLFCLLQFFFCSFKIFFVWFFVVEPLLRLVLVDYSVDLKVRRSKCACICVFDIWDCISRNYCMDLGSVRCLSMFCYWTINLWYIRKFIAAIGSTPHTKKKTTSQRWWKKNLVWSFGAGYALDWFFVTTYATNKQLQQNRLFVVRKISNLYTWINYFVELVLFLRYFFLYFLLQLSQFNLYTARTPNEKS